MKMRKQKENREDNEELMTKFTGIQILFLGSINSFACF